MHDIQTICYKISRCLELIEEAFKTKTLDAPSLGKYLHQMRDDAQNMENALKWRKEAMIKAGIEDAYQKEKKGRLTPPGVNEIANTPDQYIDTKPEYEVTVKQDGKIIYQNKSHAGVMATVERFFDIDRYAEITGQSQQFYYGHPLLIFYAFDQLGKGMEAKKIDVMTAFQQVMNKRKDVDPAVKEVLKRMV